MEKELKHFWSLTLTLPPLGEEKCASVNSSFVKLPCPCVVFDPWSITFHIYSYLTWGERMLPFFSLPLPSCGHFNLTDCAAERDGCWQDVPLWGLCSSGIHFPGLVWAQICGYGAEDIRLRDLWLCFPDQLRERKNLFFFFFQGGWLEDFLSNDDLKAHGDWLYD